MVEPNAIDLTNAPETGAPEAADYPVLHPIAIHTPDGNEFCGGDLALLEVDPVDGVSPLDVEVETFPAAGDTYRSVGYGVLGEVSGGEGTRRALEGRSVSCVGGDCPSDVGVEVEENEFLGDTGGCEGDSGGPAIGGSGRVIGVLSRGRASCQTNIYSSTVAFREWLAHVAQEVTNAPAELPRWAELPREETPSGSAGAGGESAGTAGAAGAGGDDGGVESDGDELLATARGGCTVARGSPGGVGSLGGGAWSSVWSMFGAALLLVSRARGRRRCA